VRISSLTSYSCTTIALTDVMVILSNISAVSDDKLREI
jgi:hypothetical protein